MHDTQTQALTRSLSALVARAGGTVRIAPAEMSGDPPVACFFVQEGDDLVLRLLNPLDPLQMVAAGAIMREARRQAAPVGYRKLPDGVRCRCMRLWHDGLDGYYCCRPPAQTASVTAFEAAVCDLKGQWIKPIDDVVGVVATESDAG